MEPAQAPPAPAAVILDLDGTLVDTVETRIRAWLAAFAEASIPATRDQIAPLIGSDGRRLAREVAAAADLPLAPGRDEQIDRIAGEIYGRLNRAPRPLPGARTLLEAADAAKVPWAIATSSRREQVSASVDALGLDRSPSVVDGSHVAHAKPAPDLLLVAASQLGIEPAGAWYVGDSTWDMEAARAAGMIAIAVTAGAVADEGRLRRAGAQYVVRTLDELARWLGG